jgi:hypothetical protein
MFRSRSQSGGLGHRELLLGVLCVLLVAFGATVLVAHAHDPAGTPHADCSLCMLAHAGIAPQAPAVVAPAIEHTSEVEIPRLESPRDTFVFSFYGRPPPAEPASL